MNRRRRDAPRRSLARGGLHSAWLRVNQSSQCPPQKGVSPPRLHCRLQAVHVNFPVWPYGWHWGSLCRSRHVRNPVPDRRERGTPHQRPSPPADLPWCLLRRQRGHLTTAPRPLLNSRCHQPPRFAFRGPMHASTVDVAYGATAPRSRAHVGVCGDVRTPRPCELDVAPRRTRNCVTQGTRPQLLRPPPPTLAHHESPLLALSPDAREPQPPHYRPPPPLQPPTPITPTPPPPRRGVPLPSTTEHATRGGALPRPSAPRIPSIGVLSSAPSLPVPPPTPPPDFTPPFKAGFLPNPHHPNPNRPKTPPL